jgi:DnaJ-class molecular chaperone
MSSERTPAQAYSVGRFKLGGRQPKRQWRKARPKARSQTKGCPACYGSGGKRTTPCKRCHGTGRVKY